MRELCYNSAHLAALLGLRKLHTLLLKPSYFSCNEGFEVLAQLTWLKKLSLQSLYDFSGMYEGLLLQLAQLRQLTELTYDGPGVYHEVHLTSAVSSAMTVCFLCPNAALMPTCDWV